ncbi:biogenesis of lysosomal organelles complex-1 [Mactra antiquata]
MSETCTSVDESADIPPELIEFAQDYACYLKVNAEKERDTFHNSIDDMLMKLEEFGGLFDTIRSDTSSCLDSQINDIESKCEDMRKLFARIDQLEKFVSIVNRDVNKMEECVNKAESEMSTFKSFKKMFSSLVGSKKTNQNKEDTVEFVSPEIFSTDQYIKAISVDTGVEIKADVDDDTVSPDDKQNNDDNDK